MSNYPETDRLLTEAQEKIKAELPAKDFEAANMLLGMLVSLSPSPKAMTGFVQLINAVYEGGLKDGVFPNE